MHSELWNACLGCNNNCCFIEVSKKLIITEKEELRLPEINKSFPCKYLNNKGLCRVHAGRPIDCRLFPFDIIKKEDKFFWIKWEFDCAISKITSKEKLERFLREHEERLIPRFKKYLHKYAEHDMGDWELENSYQLLREVRL